MVTSVVSAIFKDHKSQIRKYWSSFRYRKSPDFLGKPVCKSNFYNKSQIRTYLQNTVQPCLETVIKAVFSHDLYYVQILIRDMLNL